MVLTRAQKNPDAESCSRSSRPNVVLILADSMGYGDIGPNGVPDIRTPHLDLLARQGVQLTDAYATAPVCGPSRVALLTGRYQYRAGLEGNLQSSRPELGLPPSEITMARILKNNGYATALVGKWHLGFEPRFGPNAHGFDEFFGFLDFSVDYYSHRTLDGKPGLYQDTTPIEKEGYVTDLITEQAISFISRQGRGPFFLFVSSSAALPPYQPPGRPTDTRTAETFFQGTRADYIGVVEALDAGIGRILEALDRQGLAENTLVIFTHDHGGEELSRNDPLSHGFGTLWEGGIRVPCLLRWPARLPAGKTSSQLASTMDLTASILAAAGAQPPPGRRLDGIDLIPILEGTSTAVDRILFWRFGVRRTFLWRRGPSQKAVRRGQWKYLSDRGTEMLFNLDEDIGEHHDVSKPFPAVLAELRDAYAEWERDLGKGQGR